MNVCRTLALCALAAVPMAARAAQSPLPGSAAKRTVQAVRASRAPVIDGNLDDEAWKSAPEITGLTQHNPNDGQPATEKTVVRIVYDDDAIYLGAMMYDDHPVTTVLARRDTTNLESDWFEVGIDSQHDGLNGADFGVNPSNVQFDLNLYNDIYSDSTWDAVWASAAKIVPGGWVAEIRIPFSQLRFPEAAKQTWGINCKRTVNRNNESDYLVNTPKGETGSVSRFAELTGLEGVHSQRALELLPYAVTRSDLTSSVAPGDPFGRHSAYDAEAGLDLKYGVTSNLTLTGTINPDFGQVEVDPAVVNLSAFETFYPEKRPFFTEGAQTFKFGSGPAQSRWNFNLYPPQFFYSRRIGRAPQAAVSADFADAPGQTTILGAAKLTGKVGGKWSVGVLDALTDRESGRFVAIDPSGTGSPAVERWSQTVEPMTNYLVARTTREYGTSSRIGLLFTSVNRRIDDDVSYLRSNAYELGVDGYTLFHKKDWIFEWLAGSTLVDGTTDAISATQNSAARYYARPDADYLHYDPDRTSLSGFGGRAMLGRQTGKWRTNVQVQTYSPGFEVNDVGYMQRVDVVNAHAVLMYLDEDVHKYTRETSVWAGKYNNWNYGGDMLANGVYGNWQVTAKNYWYTFGSAGYETNAWDDRLTRGGPVVTRLGMQSLQLGLGSDSRRKVFFEVSGERDTDPAGGWQNLANFTMNYRPTPALRFSITPSYSRLHDLRQYVTTVSDATATETYGKRYIFSTLDEHVVDIGTRVEWTASSKLSFQLYLQPFIATGDYSDFKYLTRPRSDDYTPIGAAGTFDAAQNSWNVSNGSSAYAFGNPDFDFRSVRGSAVVRWEFRPGSALYVVWNENRAETLPTGDFRFRRDFGAIPSAPSQDVFLVKVSYWLPL